MTKKDKKSSQQGPPREENEDFLPDDRERHEHEITREMHRGHVVVEMVVLGRSKPKKKRPTTMSEVEISGLGEER